MAEAAFVRFLATAAKTGCPRDQVENFVAAGYAAQAKQMVFHAAARRCDLPDGPTEIGFGGARGPGKSHAMFAQLAIDDCARYPGLKCLLLRKVGKAVRESLEDLRLKVLSNVTHTYNRSSGVLTFPNGSRIILGHYKNESDIDSYLGLEYDVIGIEEATTLTLQKYRAIRTCCRTSKPGWRPRTYSNANPGGTGHSWYKKRFIIPWRRDEQQTSYFVPATYKDNAFMDSGYEDVLNSLVGWQKGAWRDGDWDIAAGQYFTNFDITLHAVEAKPIPEWYEVWLAMDYGYTHPTAVLLLARDNEDNITIVDEYSASKRLPEVHSAMIREMLARWDIKEERIRQFSIGQDAYAKDQEGHTVVDSYEECGWDLTPANMSRVQGATEILRRLGDSEASIKPTMAIHANCVGLLETLPRMEHDPRRPEDVRKVNADDEGEGGDDLYDVLRYGILQDANELYAVLL